MLHSSRFVTVIVAGIPSQTKTIVPNQPLGSNLIHINKFCYTS